MTANQKKVIQEERARGYTYSQIAESIGLSINTVKSFCRRNVAEANDNPLQISELSKEFCKQCGKKLTPKDKAKPKTFCADDCRRAWWNSHRDQINRKAMYHLVCAHCGSAFESYGNEHRKFCSHACYIHARFPKEVTGEQRAV